MGLYGSPQLFPPDDNDFNSKPTKKISIGRIIFIIVGFIFYLYLTLFMYVGSTISYIPLVSQGRNIFIIPVIASVVYAISALTFLVNYAKKKDSVKYIVYSVASIAIFIVFAGFVPNTGQENQQEYRTDISSNFVMPTVKAKTTLDEYKLLCSVYEYKDIARNPHDYMGKKAVYTGLVAHVQEIDDFVILIVAVTEEGNYWSDYIYVEYQRKSSTESRILQNDLISIYGSLNGIKTYTSVENTNISLPHLLAEFIEMQLE